MIHQQLESLGYSAAWLAHGFITAENIEDDYAEFTSQHGDKNPEHYRYKRISEWLMAQPLIDATMAKSIVDISFNDPDPPMAHAVIVDLLQSEALTDEAFTWVTSNHRVNKFVLTNFIQRQALIREIHRSTQPSQELIDQILSSGDSMVQQKLLQTRSLSTLEYLKFAKSGASRQIKHLGLAQYQHLIKHRPKRG